MSKIMSFNQEVYISGHKKLKKTMRDVVFLWLSLGYMQQVNIK